MSNSLQPESTETFLQSATTGRKVKIVKISAIIHCRVGTQAFPTNQCVPAQTLPIVIVELGGYQWALSVPTHYPRVSAMGVITPLRRF